MDAHLGTFPILIYYFINYDCLNLLQADPMLTIQVMISFVGLIIFLIGYCDAIVLFIIMTQIFFKLLLQIYLCFIWILIEFMYFIRTFFVLIISFYSDCRIIKLIDK